MTAWLVFIVGGIGTYLTRASFFLLSGLELPGWCRRALKYVAPAVFAAIVVPPVLGDDGIGGLARPDARLLAALAAGLVAYRFRNIAWVLVVGMLSLWALQAVGL
jgi:branched-subunit amino acid transport protein